MNLNSTPLRFACPRCRGKLAPVTSSGSATQIVRRTCPRCHRRWQLKVGPGQQLRGGVPGFSNLCEFTPLDSAAR